MLRFGYLNGEQRWKLFVQYLDKLGYAPLEEEVAALKRSLQKLTNLTPGDFSVASRQFRILGEMALPSQFMATLVKECEIKPGCGSRIGFV